jgi:diguanylate cyclase (GGDEF)-like protein
MHFRSAVVWAICSIFALHILLILFSLAHARAVSRSCTGAIAALASVSILARLRLLPWKERATWFWAALGILLWAVAHVAEIFLVSPGGATGASNLSVDASDFIYIAAIFPLLMGFSTTRELQSQRAVFVFNCAQILLACFLSYVLLYHMAHAPGAAETVMGRIYGVACVLLAGMSVLRSFTWATQEERQCFHLISIFLWTYLPIELGMDYLTQYHGLQPGTPLDLAWNIPFAMAGWKALMLPLPEFDVLERDSAGRSELQHEVSKGRLLVEGLCPLLMNAGIFALAAAVMRQHMLLGIGSLFALLVIQGAQAAVIQMNYLAEHELLLEREQDLRVANEALADLALMDPLTGIANRRRFTSALEAAWQQAVRGGRTISLLAVDVDFFKGVNDQHGHPYGDSCLIHIAGALGKQSHRAGDLVARVGGEEFMLLLPETDAAGAAAVAESIHKAIHELALANHASPFHRILTVSIGIVSCGRCVPGPEAAIAITPRMLIEAADKALYQAKAQGRNRTVAGTMG